MKTTRSFSLSIAALALVFCLALALCGSAFASAEAPVLDTSEMFTDRDMEQTADLKGASSYTLSDGEDILISSAGVYVLSGSASGVTVYVEAGKDDKVQIVLDGAEIKNSDRPCVYVRSADKVFITTSADSSLTVTDEFAEDDGSKLNGVIFSRSDVTMNGTALLTIRSSASGVVCKDDLKVTGGSYDINAEDHCMNANDSIRIADGDFLLSAQTDGLNSENKDDETLGYIYIAGGSFIINTEDDAIHAASVLRIDGGTVSTSSSEGLEATYIQINDGAIEIASWNDGLNGSAKTGAYRPTIEITGGSVYVWADGDSDAFGCKGDILISGGTVTVDVNGGSAFNFDGEGVISGGTVTVNGEQVETLSN